MQTNKIFKYDGDTITTIGVIPEATAYQDSRGGWLPKIVIDGDEIWRGDLQDTRELALDVAFNRVLLVMTRLFR